MISQDDKLREFAEQNRQKLSQEFNNKLPEGDREGLGDDQIIDTRILDMLRMLEEYRRKCKH